jgi:predicted GNAT family N-acyltransferase
MAAGIEIKQIEPSGELYEQALELRCAVLRRPLGRKLETKDLSSDSISGHFVAVLDGRVIGTILLTPRESGRVQMRQVAVAPECQGSGIGGQMVQACEAYAREQQFKTMILHARETAIPFYLKHGYEPVGELFDEIGVPHLFMQKDL